MTTYKCRLCKHTWQPRGSNVINPLSCPRCKRYDWKKKLKFVEKTNNPKDEVYIRDEKKVVTLAEQRKRLLEE